MAVVKPWATGCINWQKLQVLQNSANHYELKVRDSVVAMICGLVKPEFAG